MNRPRPVLTSAGIAGGITAVAGILTFLGYSHVATTLSAETQTIAAVTIGVVTLASHLLAALHAQNRVTPLIDPVDHDGSHLVRSDTLAAPAVHIITTPPATSGAVNALAVANGVFPQP